MKIANVEMEFLNYYLIITCNNIPLILLRKVSEHTIHCELDLFQNGLEDFGSLHSVDHSLLHIQTTFYKGWNFE